MKKFWDANYHHNGYDAVKRRNGHNSVTPVSNKAQTFQLSQGAQCRPSLNNPQSNSPTIRGVSSQTNEVAKQLAEMKIALNETVKERDFYYEKLRNIEVLIQKIEDPLITNLDFYKNINDILYATEDGFEIPNNAS